MLRLLQLRILIYINRTVKIIIVIMDTEYDNSTNNYLCPKYQKLVYKHIGKYTKTSWFNSVTEFSITICLLLFLFQCKSLLWTPLLSLTLVRTFIIFHDLGHNSFFPHSKLNYFGGLLFGTITFTPLSYWVKSHTYHHSNSNKLNHSQHAQTAIWDVKYYQSSSFWKRLVYFITFGSITLFTLVPTVYFFVFYRFVSKWYETVLQAIYILALWYFLDQDQYAYILMSLWLAATMGFVLFHIQHTFEGSYRAYDRVEDIDTDEKSWKYFLSGMKGSSYLQVPWYLKFFTCGIEYHHIHHLNPHVPCYNLRHCHENSGLLFNKVPRVNFKDIIKCLKYSIYDSENKYFNSIYRY